MKTNQELLDEANKIKFVLMKSGNINYHKHTAYERGLFFIKKAIELHGIDKYQYGLVQYVDNSTKVEILCPEHGDFYIRPNSHVSKAGGCPKCSGKYQPTTKEWIENARKVHGDLYDYSKVVYTKRADKVEIVCPEHGPFLQEAGNHLKGSGCAKCSNHVPSTEEWITLAKKVHGNRYDYSNSEYINSNTKLEIICPEHGSFEQTPNNHINYFSGCPKCAGHNHDILYLLRCNDTGWYKIGITTRDVKKRIRQIGGNIEEICHVVCDEPKKHEDILHKKYNQCREYNLCVKDGNTEFFSLNEEQKAQIRQYMASIAINKSIN